MVIYQYLKAKKALYFIRGIFLIIFLFSFDTTAGQIVDIVSSGIDQDTLYFPSDTVPYKLFVFNISDGDPDVEDVTLEATGPDSLTYSWAEYNSGFVDIGNGKIVSNLSEGGYRLHSYGVVYDTSLYVWIFSNTCKVWIDNKFNGELDRSDRTCDNFWLKAKAEFDSLVCFKPVTNDRYVFNDTIYNIDWIDDGADKDFTGVNVQSLEVLVTSMCVEDTKFTLQVTTKYGNVQTDTVKYIPIQVRAKFDFTNKMKNLPDSGQYYINQNYYIDKYDKPDYFKKYYTNPTASVPHEVVFVDSSSSKVDSVYWEFGDGYKSNDTSFIVYHTYQRPGSFTPKLTVYNSVSQCVHSAEFDKTIDVEDADFEMPNIFVINGDNVFRSYDVSIEYIDLVIVSRWGQKMHEYRGNMRDWPGWDGKVDGSNRYAKTGVYYYYIKEISGWQNETSKVSYGKKEKSGFFHVYNNL